MAPANDQRHSDAGMNDTKLPRLTVPVEHCKSSKVDLIEDGLKSTNDCPACEKEGFLCSVACHTRESGNVRIA